MPDHQTPCAADDRLHLDLRHPSHHALGVLLRPRGGLRRQPQRTPLLGRLAQPHQRSPVLRYRKPHLLLHSPHGPHYNVLHPHLDQSLEKVHPHRHAGRANGEDAAEIQSQSCQNARSRRHSIRSIVVPTLPHLREDKARWTDTEVGGRDVPSSDAASAVVRSFELLHQSCPLRLF